MDEFVPELQVVPGVDTLLQAVTAVLGARGFDYRQVDEHAVTFNLRGDHGLYTLFIWADASADMVQITTSYGSCAPVGRRTAIAEAAAHVNVRLGLGAFYLDFDDGEISYHYGLDVEDAWLSGKMIENMVERAMNAMNRYHDAFMRVAYGGIEPELAIAQVE